jgi:hypothetical protein
MTTYEISNSIEVLPNLSKIKSATKKQFRELFNSNSLNIIQLKSISDAICNDLGVSACMVSYDGKQPHSNNSRGATVAKTYGTYKTIICAIMLYKHTAKTGKVVANKTTLDTLLHELCHHFDFKLLKLSESKHTAGFYKRIGSLKTELLS